MHDVTGVKRKLSITVHLSVSGILYRFIFKQLYVQTRSKDGNTADRFYFKFVKRKVRKIFSNVAFPKAHLCSNDKDVRTTTAIKKKNNILTHSITLPYNVAKSYVMCFYPVDTKTKTTFNYTFNSLCSDW